MIHRFLIYDRKFNCRVDRRYPLSHFAVYNQQQQQQQQQQQIVKKDVQSNKKFPSVNVTDENSEISLNTCGGKLWNIITIESDEDEAMGLNKEMGSLRLSGGTLGNEKGEIVEHSQQLILGMTHSLKNMFTKLAPNVPKPHSPTELSNSAIEGHSFSMKTSKYRLIYFESFTGWKLVMLTDCPPSPAQQHHSNTTITLSNGISVNSETALKVFYTQVLQKFVLTYPLGQIYARGEGPVENDMLKRTGFLVKMDEFIQGMDKLF